MPGIIYKVHISYATTGSRLLLDNLCRRLLYPCSRIIFSISQLTFFLFYFIITCTWYGMCMHVFLCTAVYTKYSFSAVLLCVACCVIIVYMWYVRTLISHFYFVRGIRFVSVMVCITSFFSFSFFPPAETILQSSYWRLSCDHGLHCIDELRTTYSYSAIRLCVALCHRGPLICETRSIRQRWFPFFFFFFFFFSPTM